MFIIDCTGHISRIGERYIRIQFIICLKAENHLVIILVSDSRLCMLGKVQRTYQCHH